MNELMRLDHEMIAPKDLALRPGFRRIVQMPREYYDNGPKRYCELHAEFEDGESIYFGFTIDPVEGLVRKDE